MFDNNFPIIPGYEIERQLKLNTVNGITVYKARSTIRQQTIILKVFSFNTVSHWYGSLELEHEAEILKSLLHEKIPCFLRTFIHEQHNVYVYQYCPGRRLVDYTKQLTRQQIQKIVKQLLNILIYLQDQPQPIIHSQIRPENILYNEATDEIFLLDFKQAQFLTNTDSEKASFVQEASVFQPPLSSKVNLSDDLYSVGILIIQLLTQLTNEQLANLPKDLSKVKAIPQNRIIWLNKLIDKNPQKRYQTAQLAMEAFIKANSEKVIAESIVEKVKAKKTPVVTKKISHAVHQFLKSVQKSDSYDTSQKPNQPDPFEQFLKEILSRARNQQKKEARNLHLYKKASFRNHQKPNLGLIIFALLPVLPIMMTTNPTQKTYVDYASFHFLERSPKIQKTFTQNALLPTLNNTTKIQNFGLFSLYSSSYSGVGEIKAIGVFGNFLTYSETIDRSKTKEKNSLSLKLVFWL
ncbi:hypothetical protein C7H19_15220 [Aphanothece hegewaldii CCALA 016]|uniref:Protein kinase domain-containing protein n=1 Tax=Aphanothece hegewaldii CCALA 016 TaxID=2107694 RepID=A0A2T1LVM6_9CHRO|nr:protein kinase [Aphanothece hegewaldii]PSF35774.1 hypothetical protein C7H19_15220 [Aphanothece hegewaldii CCALA 016]